MSELEDLLECLMETVIRQQSEETYDQLEQTFISIYRNLRNEEHALLASIPPQEVVRRFLTGERDLTAPERKAANARNKELERRRIEAERCAKELACRFPRLGKYDAQTRVHEVVDETVLKRVLRQGGTRLSASLPEIEKEMHRAQERLVSLVEYEGFARDFGWDEKKLYDQIVDRFFDTSIRPFHPPFQTEEWFSEYVQFQRTYWTEVHSLLAQVCAFIQEQEG